MPEIERCLAGLLAGRETAAEFVRRARPRSYGGHRGRADLGGPEPAGGGVAPEESPAAPPDPPADGEPRDLGDDEPIICRGAPGPKVPPRLREAIARILESGEIGAERVARFLVGVFRILRSLEEAIAEDERDAAADPARIGVAAELAPADAGAPGGAGDDDGLPIAVRESIAGLLEGRETVAEYVARALARIEDTAQQADADIGVDPDDDILDDDDTDGGAPLPAGEEADIGDTETETADPGARGEPEEPGAAGPGERLDPPPLDDLPPRTRALVAKVLACGRPGSVDVAHALVDLYHASLGIGEGAGPAPDGEVGALGEAGALGPSDPGGGENAPVADLPLPDDLPPRLRQFLEELSASGHPAAATIVRAATRLSEAMRRCPGLPPPPVFRWDVAPADQEAAEAEPDTTEPEDPEAADEEAQADPGARGEPEEPDAPCSGDRLEPPPLDDLPPRTRALVAKVLSCGWPSPAHVAHAVVNLYHACIVIDDGAGPPAGGDGGASRPSDPAGGNDAPLEDLNLPDDLPPRLRRFIEELSASGHPAAASIVRAATRICDAMRRTPGLPPPPPFDWDLESADQEAAGEEPDDRAADDQEEDEEAEGEDAPTGESDDLHPEDFVVVDTVPLEAASEGLPPDCLGYLHVKTEFRFEGGLFALATRSPEVVVGALRAMVRRATDRMLGAAARELMEQLPPDAVMKIVPQLLRAPEDFTWQ